MIACTFLRDGQVGPFSGVRRPPAGEWLEATAATGRACVDRVHACRIEDLPDWMDDQLWRVELDAGQAADRLARTARARVSSVPPTRIAAITMARFCP